MLLTGMSPQSHCGDEEDGFIVLSSSLYCLHILYMPFHDKHDKTCPIDHHYNGFMVTGVLKIVTRKDNNIFQDQ